MKIVKSLVIVFAMVAMVAGATSSIFTSKAQIEGITFATGTLKIVDSSPDWSKTVNFSNLKPGDRIRKWVMLENTGSLDVNALTVNAININNPDGFLGQIEISVTGKVGSADPAYFTNDWGSPKPNITGWMVNADVLDTSFYRTAAGVIKPGEVYTMTFDYTVPSTLGNEWQGKSGSFDMDFTATQ